MAEDPKKSQIITAADVKWSDGTNFQGYALVLLALPTGGGSLYTKAFLRGANVHKTRIPLRVKVPIVDGEIDSHNIRLWYTESIVPVSTKYCDLWYDETGRKLATGSLFTITADQHTLTPPTLTAPTAPGAHPDPGELLVPSTQLLTSFVPVLEDIPGTGVATVTLTSTPVQILKVALNGQDWQEGIGKDYTVSGKVITALNVTIDVVDNLQVLYYA